MMEGFTHLHVRSGFSYGFGIATPEELVEAIGEIGVGSSGRPVWFLLVEDEQALLRETLFRGVYERYGELLHHRGAFLLEGRSEYTSKKGFSFLVEHIDDLREFLFGVKRPTPKAVSAPGAFLRAGRRGRRRAG